MKNVRRLMAIVLAAALSVSTCMTVYSEGTEATAGEAKTEMKAEVKSEESPGADSKKQAESEEDQENRKADARTEEKTQKEPEENAGDKTKDTEENPQAGAVGSVSEEPQAGADDPEPENPQMGADDSVSENPQAGADGSEQENPQAEGPAPGELFRKVPLAGGVNLDKNVSVEAEQTGEAEKAAKTAGMEETEIFVKATGLEAVKKMIDALPVLDQVRSSHEKEILAAWNAYHALSAEDQKKLDDEMGKKSGQSYGRDLETAYWGLQVLKPVNASTSLLEGIYDSSTDPALSSTYSKGKSSSPRQKPWSVKSVTVNADGQAVGVIAVESDSYTYIRTNGNTYKQTNTSGNSEFSGVPVDLNSTFYIAAFSTSMNSEIAFSITTHIDGEEGKETGDNSEEEIPLTGISLSEETISMFAQEVHEPLRVTLEPENTTYKGKVVWSSSDPEVVSVDSDTGEISALAAGQAVLTATAGDFSASCTVNVSEKVVDGRTDLKVTNKTAMFKVINAYLMSEKGKTTLYVTLNGDGYRELFVGTYQQAVATGSDSKKWIRGKKRSDNALLSYIDTNGKRKSEKASGKWQFAIPVSADVSCLQIQSLSHTHKKDGYWWYPRQFTINTKKKTIVVDDYRGTQSLDVKNSAKDIQVSSASLTTEGGPHSNSYNVSLTMKLDKSDFSKAYLGTARDAKKKKAATFAVKKNQISFVVEQIVGTGNDARIASRIGSPFALSVYSSSSKKWTCYELTINQKKGRITIRPWGEDSKDSGNDDFQNNGGADKEGDGVDPSRLNANSTKMPGAVDNSTTLADGVYKSDQFRFTYSGGSGRVVIKCKKVEVKGGKAYATITFSRSSKQGGASSYDSVRANGKVYSGNNTFTIPVQLNKNNTIVGRTVSMSAPHWVEYTIFIGMTEPGSEQGQDVSENTTTLDETAPNIMGLQGGKALEFNYTDRLKVFEYENGYYLIEVDTVRGDTFRDTEKYKEYLAKRKDRAEDPSGQDGAGTDPEMENQEEEDGASGSAAAEDSVSARAASLYASQIIKYLVVPEGEEAPAGLEKEVILIRQPLGQVYVSSENALKMMSELSLLDRIDSVGIEKDELEKKNYDSIVQAMELPEDDDKHISWGGAYDDWEFRTMLLHKTDLMIETADILPDQEETLDSDMEKFTQLARRSYQMGASMFLDCSGEEKTGEAKAEWYKVYGILFNCREQARKAYEAALSR